jgi:hypothetical protein
MPQMIALAAKAFAVRAADVDRQHSQRDARRFQVQPRRRLALERLPTSAEFVNGSLVFRLDR